MLKFRNIQEEFVTNFGGTMVATTTTAAVAPPITTPNASTFICAQWIMPWDGYIQGAAVKVTTIAINGSSEIRTLKLTDATAAVDISPLAFLQNAAVVAPLGMLYVPGSRIFVPAGNIIRLNYTESGAGGTRPQFQFAGWVLGKIPKRTGLWVSE